VVVAASGGGQCRWVVGVAMDKLVVFHCVVVVDCVCGFGDMMGDAFGAGSVGGCLGDRDGWWWWLVGGGQCRRVVGVAVGGHDHGCWIFFDSILFCISALLLQRFFAHACIAHVCFKRLF